MSLLDFPAIRAQAQRMYWGDMERPDPTDIMT